MLIIVAVALFGLLLVALFGRPTACFKYEVARGADNFIGALPKVLAFITVLFVILMGITILADHIDRLMGVGTAVEFVPTATVTGFPTGAVVTFGVLVGLLLVAVLGVKAAKGEFKAGDVGIALFIVAILLIPPGIGIYAEAGTPWTQTSIAQPTITAKSAALQCDAWRAAVPACGIPIRDAAGTGTLPETCRTPDTGDLPRARAFYAGFQGLHGLADHEAIAWLMRLQKEFVKLTPGKSLSPVSPPQGCRL